MQDLCGCIMNAFLAVLLLAGIATMANASPITDRNLERGVEALIQLLSDQDVRYSSIIREWLYTVAVFMCVPSSPLYTGIGGILTFISLQYQ